jgi:integral membrane protein
MSSLLQTVLGRLRLIGLVEGTSYLLLVGVAMPLKYFADMPQAVRVVGMIHGVLFVVFCGALLQALLKKQLSFFESVGVFVSSLLPFGTYVIDGRLKQREASLTTATSTSAR